MSGHDHHGDDAKWKHDGVRVIPATRLIQIRLRRRAWTRKAAINLARVGAQKIWAGTVTIIPMPRQAPTITVLSKVSIYVVRGKARMLWGDALQFTAEAGPGDFIYVPPYVPQSGNQREPK